MNRKGANFTIAGFPELFVALPNGSRDQVHCFVVSMLRYRNNDK